MKHEMCSKNKRYFYILKKILICLVKRRPFKVFFTFGSMKKSHRASLQYCFWAIIHAQAKKCELSTNENRQGHKNTSVLSDCYRQSKQ